MTEEFKIEIKKELHRAFTHLGETDEEMINERIDDEIETLMCFMAGSAPVHVDTDQGRIIGYLIDLAVTTGALNDDVVALQMVVAHNKLHYVINSYTVIKPEGWQYGDDFETANETNKLVSLYDVNPQMFC